MIVKNDPGMMNRNEHLRRVIRICAHYGRNLAWFRTLKQAPYNHLLDGSGNDGWSLFAANCSDICVLEFCKLFGDKNAKHGWMRMVSDQKQFLSGLLHRLAITKEELNQYVGEHRHQRDKFIAHLDSERFSTFPKQDIAFDAVSFYHQHVVCKEIEQSSLTGLTLDLETGFKEETAKAERFCEIALSNR